MKYLNRLERTAIGWILQNNLMGNSIKGNFICFDESYQNSEDLINSPGMDSILISILENNSTEIARDQEDYIQVSLDKLSVEFDNLINEFVRLYTKEHGECLNDYPTNLSTLRQK